MTGFRCALAILPVLVATHAAAGPQFSLDQASPSVAAGSVGSSDLLMPGPTIGVAASGYGAAGGAVDDVDAATSGGAPGLIHISVARGTTGISAAAPDVASERILFQEAADVYIAAPFVSQVVEGINQLAPGFDQLTLGLLPQLPAGVAGPGPQDNIDALELSAAPPSFGVVSFAAGHPYAGTAGATGCGSDLFGGGTVLAVSHVALGLECTDDVDAVHADTFGPTAGSFYFSLTPGSPALAAGSTIPACATGGCSAADIFVVGPAGPPATVYVTAAEIGLAASDDVDAFAMQDCLAFTGQDADGDGIDDGCDNCTTAPDPFQWDADADGFGNVCDADYDNSLPLTVGGSDFGIFVSAFGGKAGHPGYNPAVDHGGTTAIADGSTGGRDYGFFAARVGQEPGPSALPCAGTVPCTH